MQNLLNLFPQSPRMISGDLDKSRHFQTSFAFFLNLKTIRPHVRGRVSGTKCLKFLFISRVRPQNGLNNMNMISPLNLFHYLNYLQFKFDLNKKNPLNAIN